MPKEKKDPKETMSEMLDRVILLELKKAVSNQTITAALINAIDKRLKTGGIASSPTKGGTVDQITKLMQEHRLKFPTTGGKLPPVSTDGEDSATGRIG